MSLLNSSILDEQLHVSCFHHYYKLLLFFDLVIINVDDGINNGTFVDLFPLSSFNEIKCNFLYYLFYLFLVFI